MEAESEATMICVDNSRWMIAPVFVEQADAINLYCTQKLKANPRNVVGIASMSDYHPYTDLTIETYPTRDLDTIMRGVYGLPIGGNLLVVDSVVDARRVWCRRLLYNNRDLKKRIVVFAGGDIIDETANAKLLGLWLKDLDIAIDVVNFAHKSSHEREEVFETLVAAAENKRSSRILHVQPHLSVSQALASSQIIPTRVGETSSPPPDIKDKGYYSQISSTRTRDIMAKTMELVFADIYADAARKAAATPLTSSSEYTSKESSLTTMEAEAETTIICEIPPTSSSEYTSKESSLTTMEAEAEAETTMICEAEATMICVDNSRWMIAPVFVEQADAINYYCTQKLNANPRNVVGIASMSDYHPYTDLSHLTIETYPTRDLDTIMRGVYGLPIGGNLLLVDSVVDARRVWCRRLLYNNRDLKKRIVVFAGGDIIDETANAKLLGLWLKDLDIAIDVVNFAHKSSHEREEVFETLVAAAENKRKSRILHVQPHLSVSQALSSSQIIPTRVGESSSPPPDIKDKEYYSKISSTRTRDIIARSIELVWADIYADAAHKAAAIPLPDD